MIVCVTANPALDRTVGIGRLEPGEVARADWEHEVAGGKGLNVARGLQVLGHAPVCCAPLAGAIGRRIEALAAEDGLDARWTWVGGESRICTVLVENNGRSTVVNGRGPDVGPDDWSAFERDVASASASARLVAICGSFPARAHASSLIAAAAHAGATVWIDTSGGPLAEAAAWPGANIKVNRAEAAALVGVADGDVTALAGRLLAASKANTVVVTDGDRGAALATRDRLWWCDAPVVTTANATGCGDAFLAGLIGAGAAGSDLPDALRTAVVAGAAAATRRTPTIDAESIARADARTGATRTVTRRMQGHG